MERKNIYLNDRLNQFDLQKTNIKSEWIGKSKFNEMPLTKVPQKEKGHQYNGFIVLRLSPELPLVSNECRTLISAVKELRLQSLEKILDEYDLSDSRRLIKSMEFEKILELEKKSYESKFPSIHSLTSYWKIDARKQADRIEEIIKRLNGLYEVDFAYQEYVASDPVVIPGNDPYNGDQDYLDAANTGIDARWAWTQPNGEGAGVGFVDLEQGWFLNHEDFASKSPSLIYGDNMDGVGTYKGYHGTAVLGEVIADDNTVGVVGIAPSVSSVSVASHYDATTNTNGHVADAILGAIPSMNPGDVLLLEIQKSFLPTETDDADFEAIRLAVAQGIVVVEAAGNGNDDLDAYTNTAGDNILDRNSVDFRESGAIMVGAALSALPHNRKTASNYGSRIDCYAWGNNVTTCGYGDLDNGGGNNNKTYTSDFQNTSAASPIIAGAAILLQGMYDANTGTRLSPMQMRTILTDPVSGTAQGGGVAGNIGVMPNLRAIIDNDLDIVPDVYLRDSIGDTGVVPYSGGISASPDIIVRPTTVSNPTASFGQGSGTENSNILGYEVKSGQDNFIYARMKNRGGANANNVTATIYWSNVATLVTPNMWNLIGTTAPVNVPQGDTLVVTNPIIWSLADIPDTGHYCFVGILNHPSDPAPPIPGPMDWNGFRNFIRNQNNVTWRNFNVVNMASSSPSAMPFLIAGAPDRKRFFDLEIVQHMQKGIQIWLEVPIGLAKQFLEGRRWKFEIDRKKQVIRLLLPSKPRIYLPEMYLGKNAKYKSKFIVKGSRKLMQIGNWIAIRQLFEKEEVGRITWLFHKQKEDRRIFKK